MGYPQKVKNKREVLGQFGEYATFLWSLAAIGHAFVSSTFGFSVARAFLGLTEAGNFPAAIKTTAEWFPQKERALATGIFNSGSNVGAIIAPLTVPLIAETIGWKWAFIITGAIGFVWLILWFIYYEVPARHVKLGKGLRGYEVSAVDRLLAEIVNSFEDVWRERRPHRAARSRPDPPQGARGADADDARLG